MNAFGSSDLVTRAGGRKEPPSGLDALANRCVGAWTRRPSIVGDLRRRADEAATLARPLRKESDAHLSARLAAMREACQRRRPVRPPEAMSLLLESARRELGLEAHPEQVMGALAAHRGFLVEMATGEGKTLTIGLAAALAAWNGAPVHVITANDYLAARDAEWLNRFYGRCGASAGVVAGAMEQAERRDHYRRDITYSTAKEVAADFLRDRLLLGAASTPERRLIQSMLGAAPRGGPVMRGLHSAIVDEADNALIDEASTPLIISRAADDAALREACAVAEEMARDLQPGGDYAMAPAERELTLSPAGLAKITAAPRALPGLWRAGHRRLELVRQALAAREFFRAGVHYVIQDGKVVIVDELTGRLMPDRKWKQGLHQAIEAKERLEVSVPAETLARISFQRFFRLYRRLAGLTGTAAEEADELWQVYALPLVRIPTHRPCLRLELSDQIFPEQDSKWRAIVAEIERLHHAGRPVLAGTRTVTASERIAELLHARGLPFNLLNARHHREEARIVSEAGQAGRITIATNMAGRGTDIVLGPGIAELGGLHVIAAERNVARRIDRQLFGRSARQGDPGSAQAFISLEDELLVHQTPAWLRSSVANAIRHRTPGSPAIARLLVARAQMAAESQMTRQRSSVLKLDLQLKESLGFAGADC